MRMAAKEQCCARLQSVGIVLRDCSICDARTRTVQPF